MTKKYLTRLLQASLICCLTVLFTGCDEILSALDNPIQTALSMATNDVKLKIGDTYQRQATSASPATVAYSSADPAVATVDANGVVTALAAGTTTITASVAQVDYWLPASASYKVTVTPATVAVTGLTLNKANLRFGMNAPTAQALIADVLPADATDKTVTWTSSDPTVATVDASGNVTPVAKGTATITAKAGDQTATSSVYVYDKIHNINTDGNAAVTTNESWLIEGDVTTSEYKSITIGAGATVTLNGINIKEGIVCSGDATIILADGSTNTVKGNNWPITAGIVVGPSGTTLTIDAETAGDGKLNVTGGMQSAGIGTSYNYSSDFTCGAITINGGEITATGGSCSAGIGTALTILKNSTCGAITINGGTVTATGGNSAAGIGTGEAEESSSNTCGAITINGGTVTATGAKYAAGIGTGRAYGSGSNTCGAIAITANVTKVTVTKGEDSPNIMGVGKLVNGTQNCGTITFGTESVFNGSAWSPAIMVNGTYGGLSLAISTTTNADDTWTLAPVAP